MIRRLLDRLLRRRAPAGTPRRPPRRGGGPLDDGGANVREPRRPAPRPPAMPVAREEPPGERFVDLTER